MRAFLGCRIHSYAKDTSSLCRKDFGNGTSNHSGGCRVSLHEHPAGDSIRGNWETVILRATVWGYVPCSPISWGGPSGLPIMVTSQCILQASSGAESGHGKWTETMSHSTLDAGELNTLVQVLFLLRASRVITKQRKSPCCWRRRNIWETNPCI